MKTTTSAWLLLPAFGLLLTVACQQKTEAAPAGGMTTRVAVSGFSALPTAAPAPADNSPTVAKISPGKVFF